MNGNVIKENIELTADFINFLRDNQYVINLKTGDYGDIVIPRSSRLMLKELVAPIVRMYNNGTLHIPSFAKTLGVKDISLIKHNATRLGIHYKSNKELRSIWSEFETAKTKITSLKNWGYDNPAKAPAIKDKIRSVLTEKYGGIGNAVPLFRVKQTQTLLARYGVEHNWANGPLREALKEKWLRTNGYDHNFKNPAIRAKIVRTWVSNYGVTNPMQCPKIVAKGTETMIATYQAKRFIGSDAYKEQRRRIDIRYDKLLSAIELDKSDPTRTQKFVDALVNYSNTYKTSINAKYNFYKPQVTSLPELELRGFVDEILENSEYISVEYNATKSHGIRWESYVDVYKTPPTDFPHRRPMELDILVRVNDRYAVAIEMNGVRYHSISGGIRAMHPEYHIIKRLLCQRNGIRLIGVMNFDFYDGNYRKQLGDLIKHSVDNPWDDEKMDLMKRCVREQYEVHNHAYKQYTYTDYGHFKIE